MSTEVRDPDDGPLKRADLLIARAAAADERAHLRLAAAIDDFFLPDDARLDDRMRGGIAAALTALVAGVEGALTQHAGRLLVARAEPELALRLTGNPVSVLDRLVAAGLLRDSEMMRELIARVRQDVIGDALPAASPAELDAPSLLTRLANHGDSVVAGAATALFAAESRRRGSIEGAMQTDLPAELHHRLVWWVAAALRERCETRGEDLAQADPTILDRALAEAAVRSLAAHDEGDRLEAAAMRLAVAYEASPQELPAVLVEALGDRRIALFIGVLSHAVGLDYEQGRDIVSDADAGRLWLVLRALEIDRQAIARIGLALCEADPRRDLEDFADALDDIAAIPADRARAALAPLKLHPDYRAALSALTRGRATARGRRG
ncbi:hypothetical protein ASG11_10450 [Sphingomonas sp. Leaf357]|uniref:DUF2336 domain-containing protein n=1 Tax=Sphingomonas sp. Leaf357 TaxID=1736350 RepID=UPI0006F38DA4|nr:DUF2336 domain-containing protein [Sphingomonas sp. Leaf357]KQS04617.1 hypothetical protein ASG11_10450 [Sphingomonas sp. Leaf357]